MREELEAAISRVRDELALDPMSSVEVDTDPDLPAELIIVDSPYPPVVFVTCAPQLAAEVKEALGV